MHRRTLLTLFAPLLLFLAACSTATDDGRTGAGLLEPDASPVVLYADGGLPVGTVSASDDGTTLTVRYEVTEPGWCLAETHLSVSAHAQDDTSLHPGHFTGHDFAPGKGHDFAPGKGHDKHHGDKDDDHDGHGPWDDEDRDDRDHDHDDRDDDDREHDDDDDEHEHEHEHEHDDEHEKREDDDEHEHEHEHDDDEKDADEDEAGAPSAPTEEQPDPYGFPYQTQHDCIGTYTYEIPLDDLGPEIDDRVIVAAHAVVEERTSTGGGGDGRCVTGMYGIERGSGAIYRIDDVPGQAFEQIAAFDESPTDEGVPDGLALDAANGRLYLADGAGGATALSYYDLASGTFVTAGTLQGAATGAAFHDGAYWYVPFATDELHRVTFAADGTVLAEETVAAFTSAAPAALEVVDLAFRDGVMYGSTTIRASGSADSTARFFSFDLADGTFTTLSRGSGGAYLQLAFDASGTLYGTYTDDTVFYEIDPVAGTSTRLDFWPELNFTDLASAYDCAATSSPDTGGETLRTVDAWAGEKFFGDASDGARFFVYALSWAGV